MVNIVAVICMVLVLGVVGREKKKRGLKSWGRATIM